MFEESYRDNERFTIASSESHLTVARSGERVAAFDREGRPYSLWQHGTTWRRGLDGRIVVKRGPGRRCWLEGEAANRAAGWWAEVARLTLDSVNGEQLQAGDRRVLERAAAFDPAAAACDADRFRRAYGPGSAVSVLPPDAYLSVVVQATLGCSFDTCTFCDLYRTGRFRIRPPGEFIEHVRAVREFLGASAALRPRIFLGEANALAAPAELVHGYLEEIARIFPGRPVHAFLDAFIGARRTAGDLALMRSQGLARVSIGLESGHDPLLAFVRKPGRSADALAVVRELKAAGLEVNVIVIAGLGGERYAAAHLQDSVQVISEMALDARDIVYVSYLHVPAGAPYRGLAEQAGVRDLSRFRLDSQYSRFVAALRRPGGPRVTRYDIREFVY